MTRFTDHGVPVLTLEEKLMGLAACLSDGAFEDAAGHLCDLLEHCRKNIHPSVGPPFPGLKEMVAYYGEHPAPVSEKGD